MTKIDEVVEREFEWGTQGKLGPPRLMSHAEFRAALQEVHDAAVAECGKDVERYRFIRSKTQGLRGTFPKDFCFLFPTILPLGNVMKGSVAQHLDEAIDAAIAAAKEKA